MRKRKVFSARLNDGVERIILSSVGRRFQACGAATKKPSFLDYISGMHFDISYVV